MYRTLQPELFLVLLWCLSNEACKIPSFKNTNVTITTRAYIKISGCLTPRALQKFYLPHYLLASLHIYIGHQAIPNLNEGAIANFTTDLVIQLTDNNIHTIRSKAFTNLPRANYITLRGNKIRVLEPFAFNDLPLLRNVDLGDNNILYLEPNALANLPNLNSITLSKNSLSFIDERCFINSNNVEQLAFSHNNIQVIRSNDFSNTPKLRILQLEHNNIRYIQADAFVHLINLSALYLNNNRLKRFEVNLPLGNLVYLTLSFNNLTFVPYEVLKHLTDSIEWLTLIGNPFQCSCYEKIMQWLKKVNISDPFYRTFCYDNPICVLTSPSCDENIDELTEEQIDHTFQLGYNYNCIN